jgi:hyperosmotically inducible periplasmic protein
VLGRFFAFLVLMGLLGGALYYWRTRPRGASPDLGQMGEDIRDAATTGAVRTALKLNRSLRPYDLAASTENGVVTLRGELPNENLRQDAERVAGAVPDVRQVVDQIRVGGAVATPTPGDRSLGETLDDHALEVQVRLAFSLNTGLKGSHVDVSAFKRVVRLSGEVENEAQRRLALEVAGETDGVKEVEDGLHLPGSKAPAGGVARVLKALAANESLRGDAISAQEQDGQIVLSGEVRSGAERDLAFLLARDAAGGQAVQSSLKVKPRRD